MSIMNKSIKHLGCRPKYPWKALRGSRQIGKCKIYCVTLMGKRYKQWLLCKCAMLSPEQESQTNCVSTSPAFGEITRSGRERDSSNYESDNSGLVNFSSYFNQETWQDKCPPPPPHGDASSLTWCATHLVCLCVCSSSRQCVYTLP